MYKPRICVETTRPARTLTSEKGKGNNLWVPSLVVESIVNNVLSAMKQLTSVIVRNRP